MPVDDQNNNMNEASVAAHLSDAVVQREKKIAENDRVVRAIVSLESGGATTDGRNYLTNGELVAGPRTFLGRAFGAAQIMPATFTKISLDLVAPGSPYRDEFKNDPRFNPEIGNPLINAEVAEFTRMANNDERTAAGQRLLAELPKPASFKNAQGNVLKDAQGKLITDPDTAKKMDAGATPVYIGMALRDVANISIEEMHKHKTIYDLKISSFKDESLYDKTYRASIHADQYRLEKYLGREPTFNEKCDQGGRWWLGGRAPGDHRSVGSDGGVRGDKHYVAIMHGALAKLEHRPVGPPTALAYADIHHGLSDAPAVKAINARLHVDRGHRGHRRHRGNPTLVQYASYRTGRTARHWAHNGEQHPTHQVADHSHRHNGGHRHEVAQGKPHQPTVQL